jgi:hypothetical protein
MKYILPVILLLVACGKGNHVPGWGKAAVQDFVSKLGYPNAPSTCTEFVNAFGDDIDVVCAVRMDNRIYNIRCYKYNGLCYVWDNQ